MEYYLFVFKSVEVEKFGWEYEITFLELKIIFFDLV
jgi:hypothetical protein